MDKQIARDLISSGVHFGHAVSRWNPKMDDYIFGKRGMIHIVDVRETLKGLIIAKKLLTEVVASGKDVVFVGTKRQAKKGITQAAEKAGMHYVIERWLGGTLTNFRTIRSRLKRLEELEDMSSTGKMDAESKKQATRLKREMRKIKTNLEGIRKMNKMPGAVVVVDVKKEYIALREANKLDIPTIGIIDTDGDPDSVDVAIPGNDDSIKAIRIIMDQLAEAILEGKTQVRIQGSAHTAAPVTRKRSRRRVLASADEEEGDEEGADQPQPAASTPQPEPAKPESAPEPPQQETQPVAAPADPAPEEPTQQKSGE